MKRTSLIILLALVATMPACLDDGTTGNSAGGGGNAPLVLNGAVVSCEEDSDCVVLEMGCCDACNGGWQAAVNKDYEEDVLDRNRDLCTGNEVCTDMWCGYDFPRCEDKVCVSRNEDWQACETDDDCTIVQLGCCDHCNGGDTIAANAEYAEDIREILGEECDENPACTMIACAPMLVKCDGGRCEEYEDPDWGINVELGDR